MPAQKKFRDSIHAKGTEITVLSTGDSNDYILLTDIARYKSDAPDDVIKKLDAQPRYDRISRSMGAAQQSRFQPRRIRRG